MLRCTLLIALAHVEVAPSLPLDDRLSAVELEVYGESQEGSLYHRMVELENDLLGDIHSEETFNSRLQRIEADMGTGSAGRIPTQYRRDDAPKEHEAADAPVPRPTNPMTNSPTNSPTKKLSRETVPICLQNCPNVESLTSESFACFASQWLGGGCLDDCDESFRAAIVNKAKACKQQNGIANGIDIRVDVNNPSAEIHSPAQSMPECFRTCNHLDLLDDPFIKGDKTKRCDAGRKFFIAAGQSACLADCSPDTLEKLRNGLSDCGRDGGDRYTPTPHSSPPIIAAPTALRPPQCLADCPGANLRALSGPGSCDSMKTAISAALGHEICLKDCPREVVQRLRAFVSRPCDRDSSSSSDSDRDSMHNIDSDSTSSSGSSSNPLYASLSPCARGTFRPNFCQCDPSIANQCVGKCVTVLRSGHQLTQPLCLENQQRHRRLRSSMAI